MLYRLLINYIRIRILQMLLAKFLGNSKFLGKYSKHFKTKGMKNNQIGTFIIEYLAAQFLKPRKRSR